MQKIVLTAVALGSLAVAASAAVAAPLAAPTGAVQVAAAATTEGEDAELLSHLVLLKGRLIVARALLAEGRGPDAVSRHLGKALAKRLGMIDKQAEARALPSLQPAVDALTAAAGTSLAAFDAALEQAAGTLRQIEGTIAKDRLASGAFALTVAADAAEHGSADYGGSFKEGKVAVLKEFEEAYGYLRAAKGFLQDSPACGGDRCATAVGVLDRMIAGTALTPPATPALSPEAMARLVEDLKQSTPKV